MAFPAEEIRENGGNAELIPINGFPPMISGLKRGLVSFLPHKCEGKGVFAEEIRGNGY